MKKAVVSSLKHDSSIFGPKDCSFLSFKNCAIGCLHRSPNDRLRVRNVTIRDVDASHCHIGPVVFESCSIHNFRSRTTQWLCGAAFINCKLTGYIDGVIAFDFVHPTYGALDKENREIFEDNQRIYANQQLAIDITEADCISLDLRGIPAKLIKTRSEDQYKVSYSLAKSLVGGLKDTDLDSLLTNLLNRHSNTQADFVVASCSQCKVHDAYMKLRTELSNSGCLISE